MERFGNVTDEELALYLCPDSQAGGLQIVRAYPEKRALWERMHAVEGEISLWQAGLGPKPHGVIVFGPKEIRGAR